MQHWQKESLQLAAMVTVSIGTIIMPKMQASNLAFKSVSIIDLKVYIRKRYWPRSFKLNLRIGHGYDYIPAKYLSICLNIS